MLRPRQPWFGPKRLGWGNGPVSWQGWTVVLVVVAASAWITTTTDLSRLRQALAVVIVWLGFCGIVYLTYGDPDQGRID